MEDIDRPGRPASFARAGGGQPARLAQRLQTERVDVFHLHAVAPKHVDYAIEVITPALLKERDAGRIGHLGITEAAPNDPTHAMLPKAIDSDLFDVVMVAFHLLHQNARQSAFPLTQARGVATLLMFAVPVSPVFSQPGSAAQARSPTWCSVVIRRPQRSMTRRRWAFSTEQPGLLGIIDAAYRFARHEPGGGRGAVRHRQRRSSAEATSSPSSPTHCRRRQWPWRANGSGTWSGLGWKALHQRRYAQHAVMNSSWP